MSRREREEEQQARDALKDVTDKPSPEGADGWRERSEDIRKAQDRLSHALGWRSE